MSDCEKNVQRLFQSLSEIIANDFPIEKNVETFQSIVAESNSAEISVDLEIAFRTVLDDINKRKYAPDADTDKLFFKLLDFSIHYADTHSSESQSHRRLPFLLIEDALDGQTIAESERTWAVVESLVDTIIKPEFFAKGKFIILRTCNALLRKLSKSCNTEYCGRVLMFLASVYPISERSSVNVNGKVNTGNVTIYADEAAFASALAAESSSGGGVASSAPSPVHQPLSADQSAMDEEGEEKETVAAATKTVPKPAGVKNMSPYEVYKSFWHLQSLLNIEVKKMDAEFGLAVSPATITVPPPPPTPTTKPATGNGKSAAKPPPSTPVVNTTVGDLVEGRTVAWSTLVSHLDTVLELFEQKPFSASEIAQAKEKVKTSVASCLRTHLAARNQWVAQFRQAASSSGSGVVSSDINSAVVSPEGELNGRDEDEYMGCKYLTSPTLFDLQLRDPALRQEVLVQVLLFLHHLRTRLQTVTDSAVTAAVTQAANAPVLVSTSRLGKGKVGATAPSVTATAGKDGKAIAPPASAPTSSTPVGTSGASREIIKGSPIDIAISFISKDIARIRKRAFAILLNTPPNGEELTFFIRRLLEREHKWIMWKQQSCPDFERPPLDLTASRPATAGTTTGTTTVDGALSKKRKLDDSTSTPPPTLSNGSKSRKPVVIEDVFKRVQTYLADTRLDQAASHALEIVAAVPSFEAHLQNYIDAENPDNGIEEEYHPKKDEVYCWRARRLMSLRKLSALGYMADGNIGKGLRAILGDDIFGKAVEVPTPADGEEGGAAEVEGKEAANDLMAVDGDDEPQVPVSAADSTEEGVMEGSNGAENDENGLEQEHDAVEEDPADGPEDAVDGTMNGAQSSADRVVEEGEEEEVEEEVMLVEEGEETG